MQATAPRTVPRVEFSDHLIVLNEHEHLPPPPLPIPPHAVVLRPPTKSPPSTVLDAPPPPSYPMPPLSGQPSAPPATLDTSCSESGSDRDVADDLDDDPIHIRHHHHHHPHHSLHSHSLTSSKVFPPPPPPYPSSSSSSAVAGPTPAAAKLLALPSRGVISFMNSSDDVHSSLHGAGDSATTTTTPSPRSPSPARSTTSSTTSSHSPSSSSSSASSSSSSHAAPHSRRLVRVAGSAKLSSASALDDDEFGIEGAEPVDEEEAILVRSFGRSFARVCLSDASVDDVGSPRRGGPQRVAPPPRAQTDKAVRRVKGTDTMTGDHSAAAARAHSSPGRGLPPLPPGAPSAPDPPTSPPGPPINSDKSLAASRSAPPRRKSRLRITFARRLSIAGLRGGECRSSDAGSRPIIREEVAASREEDPQAFSEDGEVERRALDQRGNDDVHEDNDDDDDDVQYLDDDDDDDFEDDDDDDDMERRADHPLVGLMCFPARRVTTRMRLRGTNAGAGGNGGVGGGGGAARTRLLPAGGGEAAGTVVAVPEMEMRHGKVKGRKMVKNVSLQRDDWIDFATSASTPKRQPWLARLMSAGTMDECRGLGAGGGGVSSGRDVESSIGPDESVDSHPLSMAQAATRPTDVTAATRKNSATGRMGADRTDRKWTTRFWRFWTRRG